MFACNQQDGLLFYTKHTNTGCGHPLDPVFFGACNLAWQEHKPTNVHEEV